MGTQPVSTATQELQYIIDPSFIEESGRSSVLLARDRRCPQCNSERKKAKGSSDSSFVDHRKNIVKCCSKKDDYLKPDMPLMEAIFRILLGGPAKGVSHAKLFKILSNKWANQKVPKNLSDELVYRIAASSGGYGIQMIDSEGETKA